MRYVLLVNGTNFSEKVLKEVKRFNRLVLTSIKAHLESESEELPDESSASFSLGSSLILQATFTLKYLTSNFSSVKKFLTFLDAFFSSRRPDKNNNKNVPKKLPKINIRRTVKYSSFNQVAALMYT